ncbi:MAG: MazG-like family protein [Candidatus Altiarchaeota archaeon]|nr:MazG-like family protein [Candidatus Altiarchaeota archaeon]
MSNFKELQRQVAAYDDKMGWKDRSSHIVLHLQEELGEVAREVMRDEGYKKEPMDKAGFGQEITDLLYLTFKLANQYKVDVDEEWEKMWVRYKTKKSRIEV